VRGVGLDLAGCIEGGLELRADPHAGGDLLGDNELRGHPEYRGQEYVDLGLSLARAGHLDPKIVGDASRTGRYDDQALKRVWHYIARFGSPIQTAK
jgi:hypothetical protein